MSIDFQNVIFNYKVWLHSCNSVELFAGLTNDLEQCGFTILQSCEHHFDPQGYTAVWILAESHLALHTFPEHGYSYLELSSCSAQKRNKFEQCLVKWLLVSPYTND